MKNKFQNVLKPLAFIVCVAFITSLVTAVGVKLITDKQNEQNIEQTKSEKLVINIPKKSTEGEITVYDNQGVHFQYQGEGFNIINDGTNGEDVQIEITTPFDRDSCFDEEGRLKE